MIIVRSIIAGVGLVLVTVIVVPIVVCVYLRQTSPDEITVGFDPVMAARSPEVWLVLSSVFAVGFLLRYRCLKSKIAKNSN
jgi:uncharacterized BrkB/YihY/UPF0761 family membrane protein